MKITNPYLALLDESVQTILKLKPGAVRRDVSAFDPRFVRADNDWRHPEAAGLAAILAQAWRHPVSSAYRQPAVWAQMQRLLDGVVRHARRGKWWREKPGTGDPNINRFTLLPLLELFLGVGAHLDPRRRTRCLEVIAAAAEVQAEEYHRHRRRKAGEYPNMDAFFMLIMELAARALDRADYHRLAWEYFGYLESCLFPDGGLAYYKGTNECEIYHQINVLALTRYWELTRSAPVLELLRRTLPYYPNAVEPSGAPDYFTDPYWKHDFNRPLPLAPDILATLFPDAPEAGAHRWLANVLRRKFDPMAMHNICGLAFWAMEYWRNEPGCKPPDRIIRRDASINGLRGRFGAFSWAATAGVCRDTFVGAMVADAFEDAAVLQAAGVEVAFAKPVRTDPNHPYYNRRAGRGAFVGGHNYFQRTLLDRAQGVLGVVAPLFVNEIAWNELLPDCGWRTRQLWWLSGARLVGMLAVEALPGAAAARAVSVYFRLGGSTTAVRERRGIHTCSRLNLRIVKHSFGKAELVPGYEFFLDARPTSTELVLSSPARKHAGARYTALVEIFPAGRRPADIRPLTDAEHLGFTVRSAGRPILAMLNDHPHPVKINKSLAVPPGELVLRRV